MLFHLFSFSVVQIFFSNACLVECLTFLWKNFENVFYVLSSVVCCSDRHFKDFTYSYEHFVHFKCIKILWKCTIWMKDIFLRNSGEVKLQLLKNKSYCESYWIQVIIINASTFLDVFLHFSKSYNITREVLSAMAIVLVPGERWGHFYVVLKCCSI